MTIDLTADERDRALNVLAQMKQNLAADRLADAVEAVLNVRPDFQPTVQRENLAAALAAYRETTK